MSKMPLIDGGDETRVLAQDESALYSPGISDALDTYGPFRSGVPSRVCLRVLVANSCQMSDPSASIYIDLG